MEDLDKPFFARSATKRLVDEVGRLDRLCLFIGSGVTVDRTGLTWRDLVTSLLNRAGKSEELAVAVTDSLGPPRAASVAVELFYGKHGKANWQLQLANALRSILYEKRDHLGGLASQAIADLWLDLARKGKPTSILSTNYDQYVEMDISQGARLFSFQLEQDRQAGWEESLQQIQAAVGRGELVSYLHGCIPENLEIADYPVVSERDYFERDNVTQETIERHFDGMNVLVIGSGLADAPLMNALLSSRARAKHDGLRRFALVAREHIGATDSTQRSHEIIAAYEQRLVHFGLTGIFVDHYSQIPQFLTEVRVASEMPPGEYRTSRQRYGERLNRWWSRWNSQTSGVDKYASLQRDHHITLLECVKDVARDLNASDEKMKIELWLRWNPSNENRTLLLWASSYARFESAEMARTARIIHGSSKTCVRAFCSGKPSYDEASDMTERWKTFLGVPLLPAQELNLVVGSIVISSMSAPGQSCLSKEKEGYHRDVIERLLDVGLRLSSPVAIDA